MRDIKSETITTDIAINIFNGQYFSDGIYLYAPIYDEDTFYLRRWYLTTNKLDSNFKYELNYSDIIGDQVETDIHLDNGYHLKIVGRDMIRDPPQYLFESVVGTKLNSRLNPKFIKINGVEIKDPDTIEVDKIPLIQDDKSFKLNNVLYTITESDDKLYVKDPNVSDTYEIVNNVCELNGGYLAFEFSDNKIIGIEYFDNEYSIIDNNNFQIKGSRYHMVIETKNPIEDVIVIDRINHAYSTEVILILDRYNKQTAHFLYNDEVYTFSILCDPTTKTITSITELKPGQY